MKTSINRHIHEAASWLKQGELVAIPTETVYGLAANAFSPEAVLKIFQVKNRPLFNPLIVHIGQQKDLSPLVVDIPLVIQQLIDHFWPGPLTVLLPKSDSIPDLLTAGSPFVAIRMPKHPLTLELLQHLAFPLAAPSANVFGSISPTNAQHVAEQFTGKIPMVLDGGPCSVGLESTIIKEFQGNIHILRAGGISPEAIEQVTGRTPIFENNSSETPEAPGMLKSHYAPSTKLLIGDLELLMAKYAGHKLAVLAFGPPPQLPNIIPVRNVSPSGQLEEAAINLFGMLRELDKLGAECILAPVFPQEGLGYAINDRLQRAAS